MNNVKFSVFTKPWKSRDIGELGNFISELGFSGIEFPLRDGYQVQPEDAEKGLPLLVTNLKKHNLAVTSVASSLDEHVFAGCAQAGIPIIRIMASSNVNVDYLDFVEAKKREIEKALPLCEKYGIKIGVQHHYGPGVHDSMELRHLVQDFNPEYVGAIWDSAHSALAGEEPEQGLDIVWSHLCMVNLKNAFYKLTSGPEAEMAEWGHYFTTAKYGLASWQRIATYLDKRNYQGVVCLTAEYSDEAKVDTFIAQDIKYAQSIFTK